MKLRFIFLVLLASFFSMATYAYDAVIDGIYYKFSGNEATVTYKNSPSNSYSGKVTIPEIITYKGKSYSVTTIGEHAFAFCSSLSSITIPNSVTTIDYDAFHLCSGLKSVIIPNSVTSIGDGAFSDCSGLKSITIPNSITMIGDGAFSGTAWYNNQPDGVVYAGKFAYKYKGTMPTDTRIILENGTIGIASYAFNNCSNLISVTIPYNVTTINDQAFKGCSNLTSVIINSNYIISNNYKSSSSIKNVFGNQVQEFIIGDQVTSIGQYAFYGCTSLKSVIIPNSVITIGNGAFSECSGLESVIIPNGVTTINGSAFRGCHLKSVTIGEGVLSIASNAFDSNITKVIWLTNTPPTGYTNAEGVMNYVANDQFASFKNKTVYPFLSSMFEVDGVKYVPVSPSERTCDAIDCRYDSLTAVVKIDSTISYRGVAMTVKNIKSYTFYNNTLIKDLKLSFSGDIGNYAFYGCQGIYSAIICNKGNIGKSAFTASKIQDILIINNTGNVGQYAFSNTTGNYAATINNLGEIGEYAFRRSNGLKSLEIGEKVSDLHIEAFSGCTALVTANLKNRGYLSYGIFKSCEALETITLGDSISSIGDNAFDGCTALKTLNIPNSVKDVGAYAFNGCSSLTSTQIGTGVTTLGIYAFSNCSSLPSLTIPKSVTNIGNYALQGCTSLSKVIMEEDASELSLGSNGSDPLFASCPLDSVFIGRNITYSTGNGYGYSPFYRNTTLRSIHITDKETEISDNEFYGCTNLKNVHIGNGVTTIGKWAFSGCSSLDQFSFGYNVKSIGQEAFSDCTAMTRLTSLAPTPPVCGSQALDDINKWTCTLVVPGTHSAQYQAANQWKDFFFIEEGEKIDFTLTYIVDGEVYKSYVIFKGDALTPDAEPSKEGYTFSGWSEIPETMPANDIEVTGYFTINMYQVTFMYGDEVLMTDSVEYGAVITLPESLNSERYTLIEWLDVPETMPAHDIIIYADYADVINSASEYQNQEDAEIYDVKGVRRSRLQRGVNIIRYSNGTTKKLMVK